MWGQQYSEKQRIIKARWLLTVSTLYLHQRRRKLSQDKKGEYSSRCTASQQLSRLPFCFLEILPGISCVLWSMYELQRYKATICPWHRGLLAVCKLSSGAFLPPQNTNTHQHGGSFCSRDHVEADTVMPTAVTRCNASANNQDWRLQKPD